MKQLLAFFFIISIIFAQNENPIPATNAETRLSGYEKRLELQENSPFKNVEFRNVGPVVQSGRVTDIEGNPDDPTQFYVSYASGGLWKTTTNGISFKPLFDNQASMTIGDIAVDWINNIVYVGTGENNSSRSSYAGTGLYKTTNDGETWEHLGLEGTHRTGRIILHPDNQNIFWVAAAGALYSPSEDRGIYKTTDGGKTWNKTLYIDAETGIIDLSINPKNPDVLYVASWHRTRRAWNFVEGGKTSGIYKSIEGGNSWSLISTEESGFPTGEGIGRIGLAVYPKDPNIIYALLDNQFHRDEEKDEYPVTNDLLRTIEKNDFLKLDPKGLNDFLDRHNFPQEYYADMIFEKVKNDEIVASDLVAYLEDANSMLFDTPVIGAEVYRSDDAGKTWKKTNLDYIENMYYTYGYYFGEIRVAPDNPDQIYILGVPFLYSSDGGETFKTVNQENVHADHQALWINPKKPSHMIDGNDGGINITYDFGKTWFKANTPPVGQFYSVNVDMAEPYNVYGGTQDNGVWFGPSTNKDDYSWYASGQYAFKNIMGGDGMQVAIDTRDNVTVYTGYQFGNYFRLNTATEDSKYITPKHTLGERPHRFNWQSPVHLSIHNQDIVYFGGQKLFRSLDKGENWDTISEDLTKGGIKGDVPYGTLTTIDESPLKFGLIYVGTDDGYIWITKDGGNNWERISDSLPQNYWVSRVDASNHNEATVYASLNGYRWDNFDALVYRSTDYGKTWEKIGNDLPAETVNVIKEDPKKSNILYVGTDHAAYISTDYGKTFSAFSKGLPAVAVHDLVVHPRDNDLVLGTHGRSIFIADVSYIQKLDKIITDKDFHFFPIEKEVKHSDYWGSLNWDWTLRLPTEIDFVFYSKSAGKSTVTIKTESGLVIKEFNDDSDHGLNFVKYDFTFDSEIVGKYKNELNKNSKEEIKLKKADNDLFYIQPGTYTVEITLNDVTETQSLVIKAPEKKERGKQKKTP